MYENHFSIKLISIEKLYIMTTMTDKTYLRYPINGEWYVKESDFNEIIDERDKHWNRRVNKWKLAYSNQEKIAEEADLKIAKLKSIISDYENKITRYLEKIDIQQASILSFKTEVDVLEQLIEEEIYKPVIECELETKICNGLKCKGQFQPLESFIKNGKTLKNCKICRDYKCSLCKKSRNKSKKKELNELD